MLKAEKLAYTYPLTEAPVFEDISFEVLQGEVCAIIGKNGCGKTTLIKCLTGIFTPQRGHVDIVSPIGYVPQKVNFVYDMTVLDAIVMGRYPYFGAFSMPKKTDYDSAHACADQLKITALLDKNFSKLSGGQQQLVMVARALAVEPQCMVFDEPCSALDYGNQNHILSIISTLKENYTLDPNNIVAVAQSIITTRQQVLGILISTPEECRFYFTEVSVGNSITSRADDGCGLHSRGYLLNFYTNTINFNDILKQAGALLVEDKEECDINLSPELLEKDTFINLLLNNGN